MGGERFVKGVLDGRTLEDTRYYGAESECSDDHNPRPAGEVKPTLYEEAEIQ